MRIMVLILGLTIVGLVEASCALSSVRMGNALINVGDSERRVIQARPDREIQLETREGGAAGIRFDFYQRDQTVQIHVRSGRVIRICRVRN